MTTDRENPTAGIGDPYWYEWTVGEGCVVDMLNPDNGIESVTLQSSVAQGLDDVIVAYTNKTSEYMQIKHTREGDTITFGDMLPLLKSMSTAWADQKGKWVKCTPILFTNRKIGESSWMYRPALDQFIEYLQQQLQQANTLEDIQMTDEWMRAWGEWLDHLDYLESDEDKLEFLKLLVIKGNQAGLDDLKNQVIKKIGELFCISPEKATSVLTQLDYSLRKWATTSRGQRESINREDVYEALSLATQEMVGEHLLKPVEPIFPSRQQFLNDLTSQLLSGEQPIVFLTGLPGEGKTNIVSALANSNKPVIDLRFHAFKPITPETKTLPSDAGVTTRPEVLWGDLLTQLRSYFFKGRLARFNVPIRNDFLTVDQLRSEVLRLANIVGEERGVLLL